MKKKIKDLTFKEAQQICNSRPFGFSHCATCPLYDVCQSSFNYYDEDLEKEIEVEKKKKN